MKILITGGAGYIGSTIASALLDRGHSPVIIDDLRTGRRDFVEGRTFYEGNIADISLLRHIIDAHPDIFATIHCAASVVVPDSVMNPLKYYENNVSGTISLVNSLVELGRPRILFSSSASVYQPGVDFSVTEESPVAPGSPYASTKAVIDRFLSEFSAAEIVEAVSLRYFNPVGADPKMRSGLQHLDPSHVLGKLIIASETATPFMITGTQWPTRDGTGIRDYIHVWDLAEAHVFALENFDLLVRRSATPGYQLLNVGTGTGTTVRELILAFEDVTGSRLNVRETDPRPGDVAGAFARTLILKEELGWNPRLSLRDAISDALRWKSMFQERNLRQGRP